VLAIIALILGVGLAIVLYRGRATEPVKVELLRASSISTSSMAGSFIGRRNCSLVWQPSLIAGSSMQARWAEAVEGTWGIGALLRLIQVGNLQAYAFLFGLGVVALIYFAVMR
jgi:NADH-quinone oxidoreductase subunit L